MADNVTKLLNSPGRILAQALDVAEDMESVVIIGKDKAGELIIGVSKADVETHIGLLEIAKIYLLTE